MLSLRMPEGHEPGMLLKTSRGKRVCKQSVGHLQYFCSVAVDMCLKWIYRLYSLVVTKWTLIEHTNGLKSSVQWNQGLKIMQSNTSTRERQENGRVYASPSPSITSLMATTPG